MIGKVMGADGSIHFVALCDAGGEWSLIRENDPGKRDAIEAAQLCATHLHGTITRARTAAYKARDSYQEGRAETAATYLDLACEHLDVANTNAARLLDEPGPDDSLDESIELAEPEETASALFVQRVIGMSAQCMREAGQPVEPWALLVVADAFTDMAQERTTESADHVFVRFVSETQARAEVMTGQRITSEGIDRALTLLRQMRSTIEPANSNGSDQITEESNQPKNGGNE
jgi:hypothetical protein